MPLVRLDHAELLAMAAAGAEAVDCMRVLAKTGHNLVGEVLAGHGVFTEWQHYPPEDVYDPDTGAQYYYHAHAAVERPAGEHGHFHTFLRLDGAEAAPTHLIGISMNREGLPFRLFTTNRWVTAETWRPAAEIIGRLDGFAVDLAKPSWPINRWLTAMLRLFRPQVRHLVLARDRAVAAWAAEHADGDVFEDRRLTVTSEMPISVEAQVQALSQALAA